MGLYRNTTNGMIGGVCSGLGDYLLLGGTFFRFLFFIGTFLSFGFIFLGYLFLWIILPKNISQDYFYNEEKSEPEKHQNENWDKDQYF
jgi:phage shock protein PspC (stress-responsive transcriptional regulator)